MAEKSSSAFSHEEKTMIPETSMVGVSFLTNAFKQFANKTVMECIQDGFPASFLRCQYQYPQTTESSINANVSVSEPGRKCLHATDGLGPVSFPFYIWQMYESESFVIMLQTMN
jgi:hypothetical protein